MNRNMANDYIIKDTSLAAYGHFGRAPEDDGGFSWEKTDLGLDISAEL